MLTFATVRSVLSIWGLLAAALLAAPAPAANAAAAGDPPADAAKPAPKPEKSAFLAPVTTEHSITLAGGVTLAYTATAGYLPVLDNVTPDKPGTAKANIFYVSYVRKPAEPAATADPAATAEPAAGASAMNAAAARPVTFAFNGGPGSSSVWLHMGALGPYRVPFGPEGESPVAPYAVVPNVYTWLEFTDLVFIDPPTTGFSRAAEGEAASQFHGLEEDGRALAEFIRLWLVRSQRWLSPKYLAGESYGTTRACQLATELQQRHGINLAGLTLISPVLNFQTLSFDTGNDLAFALFVPTYCATALHHKRLAPAMQADPNGTLRSAEEFAIGPLMLALAKGDTLSAEMKQQTARTLAGYMGVSPEFVLRHNLRVPLGPWSKELLRDKSRTVGRLDGRYTGIDRNDGGASPEFDPSYSAIQGPFTAAVNAYITGVLNFRSDGVYEILTGNVQPWNYPARNRYTNVAENLRRAMSENNDLRVLVLCGKTDLATPYFAMDYTTTHLGLDPAIRPNITSKLYEAGHMMYLRQGDLSAMTEDVRQWYNARQKAK